MLTVARRVRDRTRVLVREMQLRRGLARLAHTLKADRRPPISLMRQLVRGWGNEGYSAKPELLCAILEWMPQTRGLILECGSGLSTLLLATAAVIADRHVQTLEHDPSWASVVNQKLSAHLRSRVCISVSPLKSYGAFDWYSIAEAPESIGYVVCDGPPGSTPGGRYGLVPVLGSRLAPGAIILLDDTHRTEESTIVRRWCSELGASVARRGETFTAIRLRST
jgi:predicted O-methyltransferase YrrM